mmetsp:Transcript_53076/g.123546  ORF Transcript_53076/g.123546 Transcript_53076/m.123546 type:complete len:244 (-) Transcript_53076:84-815(-)
MATNFKALAKAKAPRAGPYDENATQVYVGNLPYELKWQELKDHFKAVGAVESARILTDNGTDWGRSRGVGIVQFKTEASAQAAVAELNGSELQGRSIVVDPWTGSSGKWKQEQKDNGKGKGNGKGKDNGGCKGLSLGKGGKGKGGGGFGGRVHEVHGENLVYVGNLPYEVKWQDLKDHMKQAGNVEFCNVLTEDGTEFGRSKGVGCVRFSTEAEVQNAIAMLNESELMGRNLLVDVWTSGKTA